MRYINVLMIGLILFAFSACSEEKPEPIVKKEFVKKTISEQTRVKASASESVKISIPTVVCGTCEENITSALRKHNGVIDTRIDLKKKTALVTFDPVITNPDSIRQVISNAGYDADNVKRNLNAYQKLDECCKMDSNIHS